MATPKADKWVVDNKHQANCSSKTGVHDYSLLDIGSFIGVDFVYQTFGKNPLWSSSD